MITTGKDATADASHATSHAATSAVDTIVVGAGIAGLTAARLLARAGQDVVVLEARDRVGGRVHSVREQSSEHGGEQSGEYGHEGSSKISRVTDVGASWIHGIHDGPVYEVAKAFGLEMVEFTVGSYQVDSRPIAYFGPDGERLTAEETAAFASDVHTCDVAIATEIAASAPGTSYGTVVEAALAGLGWTGARAERVREYMRHRTEEQYGVWIDDLDAHGLDDDETNGDEVVFPHGFDELAVRLAEGLNVRLGQSVRHVHWSEGGGVRVETDTSVWVGVRVVVTVPVGVLQRGGIVVDPPLSEPVAGALAGLRMNAFEKIVLRFDHAFWDEGVYAIRRQGEAAAWWHSWYDVTRVHGEPSLLTFAAGPCAQAVRGWSDERITESVLNSLREIYPGAPDPTAVLVTRWQDDPLSHGSYAYMTVGSRTEDHDLLATPLGDTLHFAGEATWTEDPATVTAAMSSGMRVAARVLGRDVSPSELYSKEP